MDDHGNEALAEAAGAYTEVRSLLGELAEGIPDLPTPLVELDDEARVRVQEAKRAEWIAFASRVSSEILTAIEPHIEKSVSAAMAALNYLEDRPRREEAHMAVHLAAFARRGLLGCPIRLRDEGFWTNCPINLSHLRVGVSAGLVGDFECSICGRLVEDCDHSMGDEYLKSAGRDAGGKCTLCGASECGHSVGEEFLVVAYANAREVRASEISLVARPRYPQARIVEITKDMGPLERNPAVRYAAEHGYLNCDADLGPCRGFNDMQDWGASGRRPETAPS